MESQYGLKIKLVIISRPLRQHLYTPKVIQSISGFNLEITSTGWRTKTVIISTFG